jgi:hypothetical protein
LGQLFYSSSLLRTASSHYASDVKVERFLLLPAS